MNRKAEIERAARAIHAASLTVADVMAGISIEEKFATAAITPLLERIEELEAELAAVGRA